MDVIEAILTTIEQLWDPVRRDQVAIAYLEASGWQVNFVFTHIELTEPNDEGGAVIGRGDLFPFAFRHAVREILETLTGQVWTADSGGGKMQGQRIVEAINEQFDEAWLRRAAIAYLENNGFHVFLNTSAGPLKLTDEKGREFKIPLAEAFEYALGHAVTAILKEGTQLKTGIG